MARLLVALLAVTLLVFGAVSPTARAATPPAGIRGTAFVDAAGEPVFPLGANYEGPADRAWQMWEDARFDATLISQDFARARSANLSLLRLFVQPPLANDIRAGRWSKLDRVLDLADQHGLRLILTFADYGEVNVARLTPIQQAVATRYRGRATLFAYDLKNEPRFYDLGTATYPAGVRPTLQDPAVVEALGEVVPRDQIAEYRASEKGRKDIPARLSDDQAWVYANVLAAYLAFLDDAAAWARTHRSTSVGFLRAPEAARWAPLLEAINDTLAAWMKPQLDTLRAADPGRPVTIGHVDPIIGSLPVNAWLDYRTLHRYPPASEAGVQAAVQLFEHVRAAVPDKPLVLGEFGFSNDTLDEQRSAALEVALVRGVRGQGGAGALKWMLNDFPQGFNAYQNNLGMFRGDGQPKPVVAAFQALGTLRPVTAGALTPAPTPSPAPVPPAAPTALPTPAPQPAPAVPHDARYFPETRYRIDDDAIYAYFQARGQVETFGYPVSRTFTFLGCRVQVFQRQVAQRCEGGPGVQLLNLLDPELFPYTRVNGSTFPAPDEELKRSAPAVSDPAYGTKVLEFVQANAPDLFEAERVDFGATFFRAITPQQAGTEDAGLLGLLALEVWGAPISRPQRDPTNAGFVYQRFQRGIVHYTAGQGSRGILLADYLKAVLLGERATSYGASLPADLRAQAQGSRTFGQYCPGGTRWVCRPDELPGSDLSFAFEPG